MSIQTFFSEKKGQLSSEKRFLTFMSPIIEYDKQQGTIFGVKYVY